MKAEAPARVCTGVAQATHILPYVRDVCKRVQACPGVPRRARACASTGGRVHPQAGVCIHRRACASTGGGVAAAHCRQKVEFQ